MANEIDNRILGLHIDNAQFNQGVEKSISVIGRLKDSLSFQGAEIGINKLQQSIGNISFTAINNGLDKVTEGFNAFEQIAIGACRSIGYKVADLGTKLAKSLVVDNAILGWNKYKEVTQSVQTIMSATNKSIEDVTAHVERLNWFTDETSFGLSDMTSNIAKFTSAGIDLDKAVVQMQGIGNAAALAGQDASTAAHAMAGFSKAMAMGYMDTRNWMWIQTSKMDTLEFKKQLIEAGVALGKLRKVGSGDSARYYTGSTEVTAENLRESLNKKWLNTAVMEKALGVYGNFSNEIGELYSLLGEGNIYITNDILDMIDQYSAKTLNLAKISKLTGVSVEELDKRFKSLASDENALGRKAFAAAQQAITLRQAIDALVDAVSTGWMKTWTLIFGNYEEAKKLWTELANWLYEMFAEGGNARNALLEEWHMKEFGGYKTFQSAILDLMEALTSLKELADKIWSTFFPEITADKIADLTIKFREFAATVKESFGALSGYWEELHPTVESAYTTVLSEEVASQGGYSGEDFTGLYGFLTGKITNKDLKKKYGTNYVHGLIEDYRNGNLELETLAKETGRKSEDIEKEFFKFRRHSKDLTGKGFVTSQYEAPEKNPLKNLSDILEGLAKGVKFVGEAFKKLKEFVAPVVEPIKSLVGHLRDLGGAIGRRFGDIIDKLSEAIPNSSILAFLRDDGSSMLVKIIDLVDRFVVSLTNLIDPDVDTDGMDFLENMFGFLKEIGGFLLDIVNSVLPLVKPIIEAFTSIFKGIGDLIQSFFKDLDFERGAINTQNTLKIIIQALTIGLLGKLLGVGSTIEDIRERFKGKTIGEIIVDTIFGDHEKGDEQDADDAFGFWDRFTSKFKIFGGKLNEIVNKFVNINALKEIANSILKIAISIFVLTLIPREKFDRAMIALLGILASIVTLIGAIKLISIDPEYSMVLASLGGLFSGLAITIIALTAALLLLSFVNPERLIVPAVILIGAIIGILAMLNMLDESTKPGSIMAAAGAVVLVGIAMDLIAASLMGLALFSWGNLVKSTLFMVGVLALIGVLLDKLTMSTFVQGGAGNILATAGSIVLVALAMDMIAVALVGLALLSTDKLIAATGAIGILTVAIGMMLSMGSKGGDVAGMVALAGSILLLSPALLILAAALIALSFVPFWDLVKALGVLAVGLLVIVGIGYLATGAAVGLLALGASFIMIGVGAIEIAIAIGIAALAIAAAIAIIKGSVGVMIEKLGGAFSWLKEKMSGLAKDSKEQGAEIAERYGQGLESGSGSIQFAGENLGEVFGDTFNTGAFDMTDPSGLMDKISEALGTDASKLGLTAEDIANMFGSTFENGMLSYDYSNIMPQILASILNGSTAQSTQVEEAGHTLMKPLIKGSRKEAEIESPSKVYMRMMDYIVRGMEVGADNNEANISAVGAGMGRALVDATEGALTPLDSYRYNVSPSVRPVLDLTSVGGAANMSFGATLTPSAIRSLGSVSADIKDQRESMNDYIDTAVYSAIEGMKDQLTFVVPLQVDGYQFAKTTAKFTRDAQNILDRNTLRKGGYTS